MEQKQQQQQEEQEQTGAASAMQQAGEMAGSMPRAQELRTGGTWTPLGRGGSSGGATAYGGGEQAVWRGERSSQQQRRGGFRRYLGRLARSLSLAQQQPLAAPGEE